MNQTAHSKTIRGRFSSSAGMMYPPASCRAASGAPPHRSTAGHERGGGREGGFQNGIRSWISSLRQSLSILEGMFCCGGRSSPRGLSTGRRMSDGWAGLLPISSSSCGCARTAEGSTATGVLLKHAETGPGGLERAIVSEAAAGRDSWCHRAFAYRVAMFERSMHTPS